MPNESPRLKIGFIGAGDIASLHLRSLKERADVDVVSFADISTETLERRYADYPDASVYTDYRVMLKTETLDAVSVCTPNKVHARPTIDALRAGCHVLCEKPMAMTLAEAKRMVRAANETGRKLVIGFQYRYDPRTQYLHRAMTDGQFGRILYCRVQALRRRGIPNWSVFGRKDLQGGGPLIDIGVHAMEMAHYTMDKPIPVSASADMFTYLGNQRSDQVQSMWPGWDYKNYTVEDLAIGRVRFADGAVMHIESAFAAHIPAPTVMNFQLMGERGGASYEPTTIYTDEMGHMVDKTPAWLGDTSFNAVFAAKIHGFVEHVLHDKPTLAPAQDGVTVQAMLNALYRSAEQGGREVPIKL